jgi:hypothetical protein
MSRPASIHGASHYKPGTGLLNPAVNYVFELIFIW